MGGPCLEQVDHMGRSLLLMSLLLLPLIAVSSQGTDLAIDKVVLGDASVTAGELLEVTTVVRNLGPTQYTGKFDLLYYVDGRMVDRVRWNASKYPEGMPKGGQQGYIHHLSTSGMAAGEHELLVRMELVGASDPNPGNNEGKAVFTVVAVGGGRGSVEGIPLQLLIGVLAIAVVLALVLLLRRRRS